VGSPVGAAAEAIEARSFEEVLPIRVAWSGLPVGSPPWPGVCQLHLANFDPGIFKQLPHAKSTVFKRVSACR